jgi:ribulose-5-phosphate 4-epimerase/fuculose-1-phosphate aldolase
MSSNIEQAGAPQTRYDRAEWAARVDLAACYRLVGHFGWSDLIYTHISARLPGAGDNFLLNPFGLRFEEVTASNLVKVGLDGNPKEPTPHQIHRAAFVIHSAIHQARPDAGCVMHLHTRAGMAVSTMKQGLLPLTQHAMLFHNKVGYHDSEGIAVDVDERTRLAISIGDKPILILRNHGTLVAGSTIPETFSMMWHLERAMQVQVDALASGIELTYPSEAVAAYTAALGFTDDYVPEYPGGQSPMGRLEWPAMLRLLDGVNPGYAV